MDLKDKEELALEIGTQVLEDADNLRLFMPDMVATFPFTWCGSTYRLMIEMTDE